MFQKLPVTYVKPLSSQPVTKIKEQDFTVAQLTKDCDGSRFRVLKNEAEHDRLDVSKTLEINSVLKVSGGTGSKNESSKKCNTSSVDNTNIFDDVQTNFLKTNYKASTHLVNDSNEINSNEKVSDMFNNTHAAETTETIRNERTAKTNSESESDSINALDDQDGRSSVSHLQNIGETADSYFKTGQTFQNFYEFEQQFNKWCNENGHPFTVKESSRYKPKENGV